jgi:hypothetical protein
MLHFHATLHVRPAAATEAEAIDVGGRSLTPLVVPQEAIGTPFPIDFESVAAALAQLDRMFVEPDGSFVWVSPRDVAAWQVDGQLFDRAGRLLFVDLKGSCPAEKLDHLLTATGWPAVPVMIQLAREAVFVSDAEFRRYTANSAAPMRRGG